MKIEEGLRKYKDVILYLFFGACTTVVNIVAYWVLVHPIGLSTMFGTVSAWFISVLFAYVTNRKWVFHSESVTSREIFGEVVSFFGCRLATGIIDWLCMFVFVQVLNLNDMFIKIVANILVVVLNYVASKLLIFRKKKGDI